MEHLNIAKVLDVGSTENDRPYFVMELIQGVMITEYCERGLASVAISVFETLSNVQKELVLTRRELFSSSGAKQSSYALPIGALNGLIKPSPVVTENAGGTRPSNTYSVASPSSGNVVKKPAKPSSTALAADLTEQRTNKLLQLLEQLQRASAPTMIGD